MINQLFETLASDNGRKFKEDLLAQHKNNIILKEVVRLALDPTVIFIKKIPQYTPIVGETITLEHAISQLDHLATRELTGNAAVEHLTNILSSLSSDDAEVIKKIIQRDLRCGVSESTANKVWKGLIPEFPYMRCSLIKKVDISKFSWKEGVYSQEKSDGMFANVNHFDDDTVSILSRSGSEFPMEKFEELATEIKNTLMPGTQTHGELPVVRNGEVLPREIVNGILNSVLKGGDFDNGDHPVLRVWDQIPIDQVIPGNKYKVSYSKRFAALQRQLSGDVSSQLVQLIDTRIVHTIEEAMEHYQEMLAVGKEGTIIKNGNAIWEDTTSKHQVKLKLDVDVDLVVTGFTEGKGKNASTFGSVTCETSDGDLVVNVSGFKDKKQKGIYTRQEIHNMRDALIGTILTVKSNNMMPPTKSNPKWSLFLPRAVEFRSDKREADSLQKVKDQFASAISLT